MIVLLLGATGLLGHNVLKRLVDEGHRGVVLVRTPSRILTETTGFKVMEGDIADRDTLSAAAHGCDSIVNCAGVTDMSLLHLDDYTAINCTLCNHLIDVMEYHRIKRLVHVSTANTIGYGSVSQPSDESAPPRKPFSDSYYTESKRRGEQAILTAAASHPDWHAVVINPGYLLGPMDAKPSSGRMLQMGYRRRLMLSPSGGKAFVDVRDVATAVVNALDHGKNGERYIATNSHGHLAISELYKLQAQVMGYRQAVVKIPDWAMAVAGCVGDMLRQLGIRTELSSCNVRQLMVHEYYDNRRAVDELDMPETPIGQAIQDFHAWNVQRKTNK